MTMLSRVASNIYWMARYVERAEDMARLINVNTHLLLDLPRKFTLGWQPVVEITGVDALYDELHENYDERSVVRFLTGDQRNPGSIFSSLAMARENARTIRDIIPREAWEQVNELFLHTKTNLQSGLSQRRRHEYLRGVILGAQEITGLLAGTMTHDAGYAFLRMGRNLERADMTSRIIDVRSGDLLPTAGAGLAPFETIQWVSVLKSMTAYQMYRRQVEGPVRRSDVLRFLFQNRQFPRAIYHCMGEVETCLRELPRSDLPLRTVVHLQRVLQEARPEELIQEDLHQFIDELQLGFAKLHGEIDDAYFAVGEGRQAQSQAQGQRETAKEGAVV